MKKLIMAVAIAFAAIAVNAATVTWSLTGVTDSPNKAATAGMLAYFMDATTYTAFSALEAGQVASFFQENAPIYTGATKIVSGRTGSSLNVSEKSGNYTSGQTASGYIVLFDAATVGDAMNYAYTSVKSATVGAAGADIALSYGSFATATTGWQTMAVPEPTSGLLLLLGMAGLALRRKQA